MPNKQLANKPLVEAIFELRWALVSQSPGHETDPHYKLLLGRLFDRLQSGYPEHEQLPTANFPDELVGHVVQHRFRSGRDQWPLIQVGPGILTVNSTADYVWKDFCIRTVNAVDTLHDAHPKVGELKVSKLILRYIDAVEFDDSKENAYAFLRDYLKVSAALPPNLFDGTGVEDRPQLFAWQSAFKCSAPKGRVSIKFATGKKDDKPAIVWETTIQTTGDDVPAMPIEFQAWLDAAHTITDDWFFKLIAGELEKRFSGE